MPSPPRSSVCCAANWTQPAPANSPTKCLPPVCRCDPAEGATPSVSPLWADRADCGSVSRNVGTVAAIVGLAPPPVSPNPGRKTRRLRADLRIIAGGYIYEPDKVNFTTSPFPLHYFQLKSRELFAFAGLYDVWTDPATNKELYSYTLISKRSATAAGSATKPNNEIRAARAGKTASRE